MVKIDKGTIWQSKITSGYVEVMYQAVDGWVGVKILGTTMTNPFMEIAASAFGKKFVMVEAII